jgi:3'-phosphoadenosine 5'-phosphosulfate sulfotransferase (PAPS reductase)/FAD synthetase
MEKGHLNIMPISMIYIVNVSGGLTSFEALRRTINKYGKENVVAIFADTLIEDEDLYRFLDDQERYFDIKIERLKDGRTPWQTMKDRRCIMLRLKSGAEVAPCSMELKRGVINKEIAARYQAGTYTQVFGMDWTEMHRIERLQKSLGPNVWFPLIEKPYVDKCNIADFLKQIGIKVPKLYDLGFSHNNCGGGCIKAGQAHWANLYFKLPERYALWEKKEEDIRQYLEKDISILKDGRGGKAKPMTLRAFRKRLEQDDTNYDKDDWGGCGCFAPVAQLRMEDLLLESDVKGL